MDGSNLAFPPVRRGTSSLLLSVSGAGLPRSHWCPADTHHLLVLVRQTRVHSEHRPPPGQTLTVVDLSLGPVTGVKYTGGPDSVYLCTCPQHPQEEAVWPPPEPSGLEALVLSQGLEETSHSFKVAPHVN